MAIKSRVDEEPVSTFTSMIDIVFLLLIFFILQPFKEPENRMEATLPQDGSGPSSSTEQPIKDLVIAIEKSGSNSGGASFVIGDAMTRFSPGNGAYKRIAAELTRQSNNNPETPVAIMPHSDVNFEHVLTALDACYEAKLPKVKFGVNPRGGGTYDHVQK